MARQQVASPTAATTPTPAPAAAAAAAGPDLSWVVFGYALVLGGAVVGWLLWKQLDPKAFAPAVGFSVLAPLYILAQGIERFIEPFSKYFGASEGSNKEKAEEARNDAFAAMSKATDTTQQDKAQAAAEAQALVNRIRSNSTVFAWGVASFLAMVACGSFGIFLLAACGFDVPAFWDIALTGLAIGSGTKPLHDLIGNIQKARNEKADPPQVVTTE